MTFDKLPIEQQRIRERNCLDARERLFGRSATAFAEATTAREQAGRQIIDTTRVVELLCSDDPTVRHDARLATQPPSPVANPYLALQAETQAQLQTVTQQLAMFGQAPAATQLSV